MEQQILEMLSRLVQQNNELTITISELKNEVESLKNELKEIKALTVASSPIINEEERKQALLEYSNIQERKKTHEELVSQFK